MNNTTNDFDYTTFLTNEAIDLLKNKKGIISRPALLSGNTKLDLSNEINVGLALLPHDMVNNYLKPEYRINTLCPMATANKCNKICIGEYSGHYSMLKGPAHKAQIKRTVDFLFNPHFSDLLNSELCMYAGKAIAGNGLAYIRLDIFSDNKKQNINLITDFNSKFSTLAKYIKWYDYTKVHSTKINQQATALDYDLCISISKAILSDSRSSLYNNALMSVKTAKYSAIVVNHESDKAEYIRQLNAIDGIIAIDGDLRDNYSVYKYKEHVVMILRAKGTRTAIKQLVCETFTAPLAGTVEFYRKAV